MTSSSLQECGSGIQVVSRCRSLFCGLEEGQDVAPSTGCLIKSLMPGIVLIIIGQIVILSLFYIFNALVITVLYLSSIL